VTDRIGVLDHGYIEVVDTWGSDERIVEAARMSTGKGFLGWGPKAWKCNGCGAEQPYSQCRFDSSFCRDGCEGVSERIYQRALVEGVPKELARVHLPVGRYSRMRASSNLRGWMNFLALRDHEAAQWEIHQYASALNKMLTEKFQRSMELFNEERETRKP
jgi:thymidylate synthase ThyX